MTTTMSFDGYLDQLVKHDDYAALVNYLHPIGYKWRELGICLGLTEGELEGINQGTWGISRKLSAVLTHWICSMCSYHNWKTLLISLRKPLVDARQEADALLKGLTDAYRAHTCLQFSS